MKHTMMRKLQFAFLFLLLSLAFQCDSQVMGDDHLVAIQVGDKNIRVEIVSTPKTRQKGLMYRTTLPEDEGMLFIFPRKQPLGFWMKNTLIPLDLGYFDEQGFLIEYMTMQPDGGKKIYSSSEPAKYALEMNQGWFEKNNIKKYARLKLPRPFPAE